MARFLALLNLFLFPYLVQAQLTADFCFCDPENILLNTAGEDGIAASTNTRSNGEGIYNNTPGESSSVDIPASIFQGAESVTLEFDFHNQKNVSFLIYAGKTRDDEQYIQNPFQIGNKAEDPTNEGIVGMRVHYYTAADPNTAIESGFIPNAVVARGERAKVTFIYEQLVGIARLFKNDNLVWETPEDQRTPGEAFYLETKKNDDGLGYLTLGFNMNEDAPNTPSLYYFRAYRQGCMPVSPPIAADVSRCGTGTVEFIAQAEGVDEGNYRWYDSPDGVAIAGAVNRTLTTTLNQSTTYYVSTVDGPCESERVPVEARIILPNSPVVNDEKRCGPGEFTLHAEGQEEATYRWYASDQTTLLQSGTQPTYETGVIQTTTDFYVSTITAEGCESNLIKISAIVLPLPEPPLASPVTVCEPSVASPQVTPINSLTYRWYREAEVGSPLHEDQTGKWDVAVTSDTTFYVSSWNGECESSRVEVPVSMLADNSLDAGPDVRILPDDSVQLEVGCGYLQYEWSPREGLSDSRVPNPIAKPDKTTHYQVKAMTATGCEIVGHVTIEVSDYPIPNAFTPNGDGLNDFFKIPFLDRYPDCELIIFNRWGKLVYHSRGYDQPWDGRQSGQDIILGSYTYKLDLGNGNRPIQGNIMILK